MILKAMDTDKGETPGFETGHSCPYIFASRTPIPNLMAPVAAATDFVLNSVVDYSVY
jgi:hypothetical protein